MQAGLNVKEQPRQFPGNLLFDVPLPVGFVLLTEVGLAQPSHRSGAVTHGKDACAFLDPTFKNVGPDLDHLGE